MEIWERLALLKKMSGMTNEEIAEKSGISKGGVNKMMCGQTKDPQLSSVRAVVHAMGYTLDTLYEIDPHTPKLLEQSEQNQSQSEEGVPEDINPTADFLKSGRVNSKLSIKEVAQILQKKYDVKLSAKTIYGYEAGRSQPEINTFLALCEIYGVAATIAALNPEASIKKELSPESPHEVANSEDEYTIEQIYNDLVEVLERRGIVAPGGDLTDQQAAYFNVLVDILDRLIENSDK